MSDGDSRRIETEPVFTPEIAAAPAPAFFNDHEALDMVDELETSSEIVMLRPGAPPSSPSCGRDF